MVDTLTGPLIGRPKSATYRTADVVGLDTLAHVVNTMKATLPADPWHRYFDVPEWYKAVGQGRSGQKRTTRVCIARTARTFRCWIFRVGTTVSPAERLPRGG